MIERVRQQFESRPRAGEPVWLRNLRDEAFDTFASLGLPTTDNESWRYTDLGGLSTVPFQFSFKTNGTLTPADIDRICPESRNEVRIVFVDGLFHPSLSTLESLPPGVDFKSLQEALKKDPDSVQETFERGHPADPFIALNTALFQDGVLLDIAQDSVIKRPIYLVLYTSSSRDPRAIHPRNIVRLGARSEACLVECSLSPDAQPSLINGATQISLDREAILQHVQLQEEGSGTFHFFHTRISQGRSSSYTSHNISVGARLARHEIRALLADEGASCVLNGLFYGKENQHIDNQTSIDHATPHGTSSELYKGILGGKATGVFNGQIIVRPGAHKTSAIQTNKNLLLSDEAEINTKPLLEISNNDVKVNHGATIGRLDEMALFYLRSRGISHSDARGILTSAFADEVLSRIPLEALRQRLRGGLFHDKNL